MDKGAAKAEGGTPAPRGVKTACVRVLNLDLNPWQRYNTLITTPSQHTAVIVKYGQRRLL